MSGISIPNPVRPSVFANKLILKKNIAINTILFCTYCNKLENHYFPTALVNSLECFV